MQKISIQEFSRRVKEKYPEYKSRGDEELAFRVMEKYPEYKKVVDTSAYEGFSGVKKGLVKSGKQLIQGLGKFGNDALENTSGRAIEALTGGRINRSEARGDIAFENENLDPVTTSESIGKFAGDVAQFALPGGAVTKAGKVAGAARGSQVAGVTRSKLAGGATNIATRSATEAAGFGLVEAGRQGGFTSEAVDTAILSALFPFVGSTVGAGLKNLNKAGRKELASRFVNSVIKPSKNQFAYGKNPGKAVAEEGITGSSLQEIERKIGSSIDKRTEEVKQALKTVDEKGASINIYDDALNIIDEEMSQLSEFAGTNSALITRLKTLRNDLVSFLPSEKVPLAFATEVKSKIGSLTKFTGNQSDDAAVNAAQQRIYRMIREKIEKEAGSIDRSVDIKIMNERIGNLISAFEATKNRASIAQRNGIITLSDNVAAVGGVVSGLATGGISTAALFTVGAVGMNKFLKSPKGLTQTAKWLASTSTPERNAAFKKAPWLKAAIIDNLSLFEVVDALKGE